MNNWNQCEQCSIHYNEETFIASRKMYEVSLQKRDRELFCRLFLHILAFCEQNIIIHILNPFNLDERLIKETVVSHNVGSFYFLNNMLNLARRKEASRNTHAIITAPYLLSNF